MTRFRLLPSVDQLLRQPRIAAAAAAHGRDITTAAARAAIDDLRRALAEAAPDVPDTPDQSHAWLAARVTALIDRWHAASLDRVINATGVIVHTNLGRAPLAAEALARAASVGAGYSNLEYDLQRGQRGHRHVHAEDLLRRLTGADAAAVVNNNAAAMLLVLAALAAGREVIVSRGELVEIGGGFRVPDVLEQSGARLREVGTTNRTRTADYAAAISDRTALLLRVHPSNFAMTGFTERPALPDLAALARRFELPLVEDLGSGWPGLGDPPRGLAAEPSIHASLSAGADLVAFSGDKLLGGPQAGIVVGRRDLIDRVRRHPLMRAVRADKLAYAALEATLALWIGDATRDRIPVYRMLTMSAGDIEARADRLRRSLAGIRGLSAAIVPGFSTTGGGSAPDSALPTALLALRLEHRSPSELGARLRGGQPPVIGRIVDDRLVLDLRTVPDDEDSMLEQALLAALGQV
jgi:L-seryl-tRNA(Ser) seleniumtransferase